MYSWALRITRKCKWVVCLGTLALVACGGGGDGGGSSNIVPNVVGDTQGSASTAITGAGLVVGTITRQSSSTAASGSVISESPGAGTDVASGSAVNLVVSSGKAQVAVPNVVGDTEASASTAIIGAGLVVGTTTQQSSSTVASGSVIGENPAAGTDVASGSAIALIVSSGPASGTGGVWTPVAPLPVARGEIGVASLNGKLYALGGYSNPNNSNELSIFDNLEVYDPSTNTWTELNPFPLGPAYGVALVGINNLLYAFGGYIQEANGGAYYGAWSYDPASNQWQQLASFPSFPTGFGGMGVATDGTFAYLIGGFDAINAFNSSSFRYDPQTNQFSELPITTSYVPLANPAVGWVNGNLVVAPGYTANESPAPTTVYVYDSAANSWSQETMPFPNGGSLSAGAVIGTTFYVVEGNSLTAFDLTTDTWTKEVPLPATPMVNSEGVGAINGVLYVVGGIQEVESNGSLVSSPGTNAVWAYTPADPALTAGASKAAAKPAAHATENKADNRQGQN
jgi:N-acetylneuraminic acid mutarotase